MERMHEMNGLSEYLYSPSILSDIDFSSYESKLSNGVSPTNPGEDLIMRPLSSGDFDRGYLKLLSNLTHVGEVSKERFVERFAEMKKMTGIYYITVIEDKNTNEVIASGSLFIELKFIHSTAKRGRIEDLVVNSNYRGRQLGKLMIVTLTALSKHIGCYKVTLDCKDGLVKFYSQSGFVLEEGNSNSMCLRFYK